MNKLINFIVGSTLILLITGCDDKSISLYEEDYGVLDNGILIKQYIFENDNQMKVKIINYGAIVVSIEVPDKKGKINDVVLGYDSIDGYVQDPSYFGAIVGRVGNRISKGKFSLDGKDYALAINNNENHLHGGIQGFNKKVWTPEITESNGLPALKLTYLSPDGEEGYPGNLNLEVTYTISNKNELIIDYFGTTDKATILNPTNHSYFNLSGAGNGDILDHVLKINADYFTPVDKGLIPLGNHESVLGTPMDFLNPKKIGERINNDDNQLKVGLGYDHNWVFNNWDGTLKLGVTLFEPESGRFMEVFTTEPGVQFYSGNFLDGTNIGKNQKAYQYRSALCLETDHFPDSQNNSNFPSVVLRPGEEYKQKTIYQFSTK
ncbi:MAG: galactose-1-epimerase [Candidatus Marinimicrobia bacterium]|nr:galactose-1-epimerase [Candidatus Neomarinimicrobiota bacterium]